MAYKHGVYTSEIPTSLVAPIQGSAGLQVIFGTAPVHLAEDPKGAANVPKLCFSFAEAVAAVGYCDDFENFTLCQAIDACFRVFNVAPIILVNVLDPENATHVTDNAAANFDVVDNVAEYTKKNVLLYSMVVKNGDTTLADGTDYVAEHSATGGVTVTLISTAAKTASALSIASKSLDPSAVEITDIVGGVNSASGVETGMELVRQIYPRFGMAPGLLLAPGWSQYPVVAAALQAKTENINGNFSCSCLLDIPTSGDDCATTYTEVKTAKEALGASSSHAVALWPMVAVGTKRYYYSAVFGALCAYTDASNGDVPHESPSNKELKGITATVLDDGTAVTLDQEQGNTLNGVGVVTAINANGFKAWGNNTAAYPSTTDPKDRWIATRRFFDWDGNNFILTYFQKVDKPGNRRLIQSIVDSQNIIGNGYVARDYCAGYKIEFRTDENPVTSLLDGHLTTHTYMAPYVPAEMILNIREYDTTMLVAAVTGGE